MTADEDEDDDLAFFFLVAAAADDDDLDSVFPAGVDSSDGAVDVLPLRDDDDDDDDAEDCCLILLDFDRDDDDFGLVFRDGATNKETPNNCSTILTRLRTIVSKGEGKSWSSDFIC